MSDEVDSVGGDGALATAVEGEHSAADAAGPVVDAVPDHIVENFRENATRCAQHEWYIREPLGKDRIGRGGCGIPTLSHLVVLAAAKGSASLGAGGDTEGNVHVKGDVKISRETEKGNQQELEIKGEIQRNSDGATVGKIEGDLIVKF
jgi:hypothetical protein